VAVRSRRAPERHIIRPRVGVGQKPYAPNISRTLGPSSTPRPARVTTTHA
jgi:hypothetical protein